MAQNGREVPLQFSQVTLGGQKYDIRPLPILQARTWRQAVKEPLQLIISTVANLPELSLQDLELTSIVGLIQHLFSTVADAPDLILNWLYAYAPNIAEDKERIESAAFDTEVAEAFAVVVKQVYPLARLASALGGKKFTTS
ncbi:MAG TPA: hypothetical protein VF909_15920 [Roseiflexaceae bacterium]